MITDVEMAKLLNGGPTVRNGIWPPSPFRAPEVESNQVTPAADLFSWAVVLLNAATGHVPDSKRISGLVTEAALPDAVSEIVRKCLKSAPTNRPQDCRTVQKAIAKWGVGRLSTELHDAVTGVKGFPIQVFTRSLAKITNILEGSIGTSEPEGSTQRLQYTAPGTLGHSLKELKVGQATEKLGQLADEVGIRLDSDAEVSLAEISGSIVQSFHDLVKDFQRERQRLDDLSSRLTSLKAELDDAPGDFTYPPSLPALGDLLARPALIDSALSETLSEDVESLISEHEPSSRLGNFHPLMTSAKGLLAEPKSALGRLAGQVATLENSATGYRQILLDSDELRSVEGAFAALLQSQRKTPEKALDMADLKRAGSLKSAKELVTSRCTTWPAKGDVLLTGTGVTFDAWASLVRDLANRQKPTMTGQQIQSLVDHGFIEVTYRLGGGA
jgi:hypothetical protein